MDSSKFINMIVCYPDPDNYFLENCPVPPNLFYIHDILGVLVNAFGFSKEDAKLKIKKWIEKYNIQRIKVDDVSDDYVNIVKDANIMVIQRYGKKYKIGLNDIMIIAGFLKEGINIVYAL